MLQLDKRAVSLIVSYVLLISIGLSIAGLVYGWLRFYVDIEEAVKCPEGVSLILTDIKYEEIQVGEATLNLTIQNKGLFDIEGYVIRVNNRTGSKVGINTIYRPEDSLAPSPSGNFPLKTGQIFNHDFSSEYLSSRGSGRICFIEIQPYIREENNQTVPCSQISSRIVNCQL